MHTSGSAFKSSYIAPLFLVWLVTLFIMSFMLFLESFILFLKAFILLLESLRQLRRQLFVASFTDWPVVKVKELGAETK